MRFMLRPLVLLTCLLVVPVAGAQALRPDWVRSATSSVPGLSRWARVVPDSAGGSYLVSLDRPWMTSVVEAGLVVRRLDRWGSVLWTRNVAGATASEALITVDPNGNISLASSSEFSMQSATQVVSFTREGALRYLTTVLVRPGAQGVVQSMASDAAGRVFLAGTFRPLPASRSTDVVHLSPTGTVIGRFSVLSVGQERALFGLAVDGLGRVILGAQNPGTSAGEVYALNAANGAVLTAAATGVLGGLPVLGADASGRVYIASRVTPNLTVRRLAAANLAQEIVRRYGIDAYPARVAVLPNGTLYATTFGSTGRVVRWGTDNSAHVFTPTTATPLEGLVVDAAQNRVFAYGRSLFVLDGSTLTASGNPTPMFTRAGAARAISAAVTPGTGLHLLLSPEASGDWEASVYSVVRRSILYRVNAVPVAQNWTEGTDAARGPTGTTVVVGYRGMVSDHAVPFAAAYAANGGRLWSRDLGVRRDPNDTLFGIPREVLPFGNDFVVLTYHSGFFVTVTRLRGTDGAILWQTVLPEQHLIAPDGEMTMTVSGGDLAVAIGSGTSNIGVPYMVRLVGSTGAVRWSRARFDEGAINFTLRSLPLIGGGQAVAVSTYQGAPLVWSLDLYALNADGSSRWQRRAFSGAASIHYRVSSGAVLPNGQTVFLVQEGLPGVNDGQWSLLWLNGTTGATVRLIRLPIVDGNDGPAELVADAAGNVTVAVSGRSTNATGPLHTVVASYVGATGVRRYLVTVRGAAGTADTWLVRGLSAGASGTAVAQFERTVVDPLRPEYGAAAVVLRFAANGAVTGSGVWGNRQPGRRFRPFAVGVGPGGDVVSVANYVAMPTGREIRLQRFVTP